MTSTVCANINRMYANNGQHWEQALAYTLTHEIRTHDSVPFDMGSDIPEYNMSVKSSRATIVSANRLTATDKAGQMAEYFSRVYSTSFAYVTNEGVAYIMNKVEFRQFLTEFVTMQSESSKNGGKMKMRLPAENKKMLMWLTSRV